MVYSYACFCHRGARPVCHAVSKRLGYLCRLMLLVAEFSRWSNSLDMQDFFLAAYQTFPFGGKLNQDEVILETAMMYICMINCLVLLWIKFCMVSCSWSAGVSELSSRVTCDAPKAAGQESRPLFPLWITEFWGRSTGPFLYSMGS